MSKSVLHVVPHDDGWSIKREGNERASSSHGTQKDAIEAARELAKENDDIIIHRPDGTIRERITYHGPEDGNEQATGSKVRPRDVSSVGSRVSWGAVIAGVVVAMAMYITFSLLAVAVGVTTIDNVGHTTFTVTGAIIAAVILLGSLFMGGFVAARTTVGEQPGEAMTYGILVWGATLLLLLVGGLNAGMGYLSGVGQFGPSDTRTVNPAEVRQQLGLTPEQFNKYEAMATRQSVATSPAEAAWWTFGGVALSLIAAIAGGAYGAGPSMVLREIRNNRFAKAVPKPS